MSELAQAGVVAKGADQPDAGGRRNWIEVSTATPSSSMAKAPTTTPP